MLNVEYRGKYRLTLLGDKPGQKVSFTPESIRPVDEELWEKVKGKPDVDFLVQQRKLVVVSQKAGPASTEAAQPANNEEAMLDEWRALHWKKCKDIIEASDDIERLSALHMKEERPKVSEMLSARIEALMEAQETPWSPGPEGALED